MPSDVSIRFSRLIISTCRRQWYIPATPFLLHFGPPSQYVHDLTTRATLHYRKRRSLPIIPYTTQFSLPSKYRNKEQKWHYECGGSGGGGYKQGDFMPPFCGLMVSPCCCSPGKVLCQARRTETVPVERWKRLLGMDNSQESRAWAAHMSRRKWLYKKNACLYRAMYVYPPPSTELLHGLDTNVNSNSGLPACAKENDGKVFVDRGRPRTPSQIQH